MRTRRATSTVAIAAMALGLGGAVAGCGGDGGPTTTTATETAVDTGVVTIQTDTRLDRTNPPADTTAQGATTTAGAASTGGPTGNAALDAAVAQMSDSLRSTVADLKGSDAAALVAAITKDSEAFDRAIDTVKGVVTDQDLARSTQQAIAGAATVLSDAYRTFADAAAQAADSNSAASLAKAKAALMDSLHQFDEAAGVGN